MSEERKIKQFNLQNYLFEVSLLPYGGDEVFINPEAILQLVFEDSLFHFSKKGFILFQNGYEMFEREVDVNNFYGKIGSKELSDMNKEGYVFRNDGKDKIKIKIKPIKSKESEAADLEEPPDSVWLIEFVGNIYDFEDPMVNELSSKCKKLYFWNENFQKMVERDLDWSTATSTLNENTKKPNFEAYLAKDEEREMLTGEAIKDILKNKMGFEIDEAEFDKGSTKIFHTANGQSNVWRNIEYLLENHLSEKVLNGEYYDICFLQYNEKTKQFQLTPLTKIFEKAGNDVNNPKEFQVEHLLLEDIGNLTGDNINENWMAPILKQYDPEKDVKIVKLKKYSFSDLSGVDSLKVLITTPIFMYDRKNKTFKKSVEKSIISDIPKNLEKDYIEPYFLFKEPATHINLNKVKKQNLKVNNIFTPIVNEKVLEKLGHSRLIFSSIFLNLCLTVESEGSTIRRSGRFVGVDRLTKNNTDFDYKIGGQWFIVNVKHNFFKNSYSNEITCVKPHTFKKIQVEEDID
jgi:hypothetical protein